MTLREAQELGSVRLRESGIEEASTDAWLLLEFVSKVSRAMYFADSQKVLTSEQEALYLQYIEKRAARIPLQHLTGVQEFMGLEFMVSSKVLIPRQDTETLVETALDVLKLREPAKASVQLLDLCTGSGCILLSISHYAAEAGYQDICGTGTDISPEALEVAKENAQKLGIKAEFIQSNLFGSLIGMYDMIVSNPPYIRTSEIEVLQDEVRDHDPYLALDGKDDGLYFYREIIRECGSYLKADGILIFEIGCTQAEDVMAMMAEEGLKHIEVKKDLTGLDRVVSGMYDR